MTQSRFYLVQAGIYLFFALSMMFFPNQLLPVFGLSAESDRELFLSWHNSIFMYPLAWLSWSLRDVDLAVPTARNGVIAMLMANTLGVLVTATAFFLGMLNWLGIFDPIFFSVLVLGNVYFLRRH